MIMGVLLANQDAVAYLRRLLGQEQTGAATFVRGG